MKHHVCRLLTMVFACFVCLVPQIISADDLVLQGSLQNRTYSISGTIQTQGDCEVTSGTQVLFDANASKLNPGFRVKAGGTLSIRIIDLDGLPNDCELHYFGNYDQGPEDDPDNDRLTNLQECQLGTDPTVNNPDNDNDGLEDWWEVQYANADLSLLDGRNGDADGDGVSNWVEYRLGSNPMAEDLPGPGIYYEYDTLGRIITIKRMPAQ